MENVRLGKGLSLRPGKTPFPTGDGWAGENEVLFTHCKTFLLGPVSSHRLVFLRWHKSFHQPASRQFETTLAIPARH
jgi:hypothetical protein